MALPLRAPRRLLGTGRMEFAPPESGPHSLTEDVMHAVTRSFRTQRRQSYTLVGAIVLVAVLAQPNWVWAQQDADAAVDDSVPVKSLFEDFLHFAKLGKFPEAEAHARRLLEHPDLDPVELLSVAEQTRDSFETLMLIVGKTPVGDSAKQVLEVLAQGELALRQDTARILANIEKLGGPPQTEHNATQRLVESGEYAVPWLLQALGDPAQVGLHARILTALPKLGRAAVGPLVAALNTTNDALRGQIIQTLGRIGYAQAGPYLQSILLSDTGTQENKAAARSAIQAVSSATAQATAAATAAGFISLAEQYYDERGSVAADPRVPMANVWGWNVDEGFLQAVAVPRRIFGQVMAMQCCERALLIEPSNERAIALWLAANIRREARLGIDVERAEPGEPDEPDATRSVDFPPSLYFTRLAGARYAHLALERAIHDRDTAVALGALAALRVVAGESSLIGAQDYKQPLVQALSFPDRLVRIRAALVLGNALPRTPFAGVQLVGPLLADALGAGAQERYALAESDADNRNRLGGALRDAGAEVIAEENFYQALDRVRREWGSASVFLVASDLVSPGLGAAVEALAGEYAFANTPVVILVKPDQSQLVARFEEHALQIDHVEGGAAAAQVAERLQAIRARTGQNPLSEELASAIALEAAGTLYRISLDGRTAIDCGVAEPALISALGTPDPPPRTRSAEVLAMVGTSTAQRALADLAFDESNDETLRMVAFGAVAESAKRFGALLDEARTRRLLEIAKDELNLTLRTSASQVLGALNLSDNQASEIIRSYHRE
ncbi:MAG: HEAT repeat domain-containing protein [bacterium]|nr:HEAT repeat domain-containing protein [bacterium]